MKNEISNSNFFIDISHPENDINMYVPISKNVIASLDSIPNPNPNNYADNNNIDNFDNDFLNNF